MKRLIAFCFLLITLICSSLNAQWYLRNSGLPEAGGTAIDAFGESTALIFVGAQPPDHKGLFLTTDKGITWQSLDWPSEETPSIFDLSITDSEHFWLAATGASQQKIRILATPDAGQTWAIQYEDSINSGFLNYIEMFDQQNGVAMGDAKTYFDFESICVDDPNNIVAFGDKSIFSQNGGTSWTERIPESIWLNTSFFLSSQIGWFTGVEDNIYKTVNAGVDWEIISNLSDLSGIFSSIHFVNESVGWIASWSTIYKSTDGGVTWTQQYTEATNAGWRIEEIYFLDQNNGWIIFSADTNSKTIISRTTDGGNSWTAFEEAHWWPTSIFFLNGNVGWMAGNRTYSTDGGVIYKTEDSGSTWVESNDIAMDRLFSIQFRDENNGCATGAHGTLYRTFNGGSNWIERNTNVPNTIYDAQFLDLNNGWAVGENNIILKTTDAGWNWEIQNGGVLNHALFLHTTDGGENWINQNTESFAKGISYSIWNPIDFYNNVGFFYPSNCDEYGIYKTTDYGQTWEPSTTEYNSRVMKLYNENIAISYSESNVNLADAKILLTQNGGESWAAVSDPMPTGWASDFEFLRGYPSNIWYSTWSALYFSNDMGSTWEESIFDQEIDPSDLVFTDPNHGWLLCSDGLIYYTDNNGGMIINDADDDENIPTRFMLHQNYPNPFNPTTQIEFTLLELSRVKLEVFNLLGEKVTVLVNKELSSGNHSVEFNAENLPSGIYFYNITAGSFRESRKMVLLK